MSAVLQDCGCRIWSKSRKFHATCKTHAVWEAILLEVLKAAQEFSEQHSFIRSNCGCSICSSVTKAKIAGIGE
jgi:hypothetical protein